MTHSCDAHRVPGLRRCARATGLPGTYADYDAGEGWCSTCDAAILPPLPPRCPCCHLKFRRGGAPGKATKRRRLGVRRVGGA